MFQKFLRFFNNPQRNNQRILRHMDGLITGINALENEYRAFSDEALAHQTILLKERYNTGESLDSLLVPAFATVREAARRVLGMRPFDVQLRGGIALHQGMIAEMKTGEGKTLVATLSVYLNALTGEGVHVVTVNDYLAQRDSSVMRPLYEFLGLSVGCIIQDLSHSQRRKAYHSDITYGTNNEFGFDYLKDNMKFTPSEMCQRGFSYAIVDEVDSILIDEARTPLIISGPAEDASHLYDTVNAVIVRLQAQHYELDEKTKSVAFTDEGYVEIERLTREAGLVSGKDLFQFENLMLVHHLNQSLKAHKTFQKDIDYIVKDGKVVLIDEFTGRMMKGRRYSDGLHQAIEAKENVDIEVENQTLASITFQNFFRMYKKLAGMTGTAETEAVEFHDIYKLPVLSIPTNLPVARKDLDDEMFRTFHHKLQVILKQIKECHDRKQPVLVGTLSIEKSEIFADALKRLGLPFHVLNARHHEQEAKIIAQAGEPGAITIATNMAGRGTDIKLGGNIEVMMEEALRGVENEEERAAIEQSVRAKHKEQEEIVRKAGGLFVLGTERNENRRIDNQLRGRSGRQGDFGASKFFISLEDDLMRIFGPNLKALDYSLRKTDASSDADPIAHPWLTRSIEKAQQKVEAQHFDTRKHLLKYADVLNAQRTAVYDERHALMHAENVHDRAFEIAKSVAEDLVHTALDQKKTPNEWNWNLLKDELDYVFGISVEFTDGERASAENILGKIQELWIKKLESFQQEWGLEVRMRMEKSLMLKTLDQTWIGHLNAMDHLRSGIHLQAYGQKDPLNEYRHEAFVMFKSMKNHWYRTFLHAYFHANPAYVEEYEEEDDGIEALLQKWSQNHKELLDSVESEESADSSDNTESASSLMDEKAVDYRKILDQLLAEDRQWDKDAFDEKDLDDLWGSEDVKSHKKKGANSNVIHAKQIHESSDRHVLEHKKSTSSQTRGRTGSKNFQSAGTPSLGSRSLGETKAHKKIADRKTMGPKSVGSNNSSGKSINGKNMHGKSSASFAESKSFTAKKDVARNKSGSKLDHQNSGNTYAQNEKLRISRKMTGNADVRNKNKSIKGLGQKMMHIRSVEQSRKNPFGTVPSRHADYTLDLGASTVENARKPRIIKRRAPSKRGAYVPKAHSEKMNSFSERRVDGEQDFTQKNDTPERAPERRRSENTHHSSNFQAGFSKPKDIKRAPRKRTAVGRGPANRGIPKEFVEPSRGHNRLGRSLESTHDTPMIKKDPKTRWQSAGSGAQRPGRSASTRPAFDSWKIKDTGENSRQANQPGKIGARMIPYGAMNNARTPAADTQTHPRSPAGKTGARVTVKNTQANPLLQQFYSSRAVGGGRSFARSRVGIAQRLEKQESDRVAALPPMHSSTRQFTSSKQGQKTRTTASSARFSKENSVRSRPVSVDSQSTGKSSRNKLNTEHTPRSSRAPKDTPKNN